jgi:hypothetical protein
MRAGDGFDFRHISLGALQLDTSKLVPEGERWRWLDSARTTSEGWDLALVNGETRTISYR